MHEELELYMIHIYVYVPIEKKKCHERFSSDFPRKEIKKKKSI